MTVSCSVLDKLAIFDFNDSTDLSTRFLCFEVPAALTLVFKGLGPGGTLIALPA
jgi:hypothetical protein